MNKNNVFICGCCSFAGKGRRIAIYMASILFALGWWAFIDGLIELSILPDRKIAPGIEDYMPGIITTLGMIIVNLIDKEALRGDGYDDSMSWRARLFLFLGFTLMAGGVSGSVAVLVVKYVYEQDLDFPNQYLGITGVTQCVLIMISTAVLWVAQNASEPKNVWLR
ncbi:hypothetical protein BY458DRAFT_497350, partial [Sporodiniella umbellata]